jgi:hypothetical protein
MPKTLQYSKEYILQRFAKELENCKKCDDMTDDEKFKKVFKDIYQKNVLAAELKLEDPEDLHPELVPYYRVFDRVIELGEYSGTDIELIRLQTVNTDLGVLRKWLKVAATCHGLNSFMGMPVGIFDW